MRFGLIGKQDRDTRHPRTLLNRACCIALALRIAAPLLPGAAGCSADDGNGLARSISGTEQVAIREFAISVSPDERWLAFTEWVLPWSRVLKDLPPDEYPVRVTTLNLETSEVVPHAIESLSPNSLRLSSEGGGWKRLAGLEIIEKRFRPPGWRGDVFYLQPYYGIYVAVDCRLPGMQILPEPDAVGTCSDCSPIVNLDFGGRSWDLVSNNVGALYRNSAIRAVYYRGESPDSNHMILRLREDSGEEVIVDREQKKGRTITISGLRVSPNEKWLAFVVRSKKREFMAAARKELFIKDMESGRELRVAKYGFMSNLIWSPDSQRLYFAGGEYETDGAVRVVDVAAAFAR